MKSYECKSRAPKAGQQAGSECCHLPGDGGCEAYTARKQAAKHQLRNNYMLARPTLFARRKAASGTTAIAGDRPA
jgi:hypothetical protein